MGKGCTELITPQVHDNSNAYVFSTTSLKAKENLARDETPQNLLILLIIFTNCYLHIISITHY